MKEQELYEYLKTNQFSDLEKSNNSFDGFDCITKKYGMFIELKSRHTHYDTLLLEKKKYDFLITEAVTNELKPYYINSTPEGIWQFNLLDIKDIKWEQKWLPTTTEFTNTNKKIKEITFLHIDIGIKLK